MRQMFHIGRIGDSPSRSGKQASTLSWHLVGCQDRCLTVTHGQPQMVADLQLAGQRGMAVQFPS